MNIRDRKDHKCQCGKSYGTVQELKRHILLHNNIIINEKSRKPRSFANASSSSISKAYHSNLTRNYDPMTSQYADMTKSFGHNYNILEYSQFNRRRENYISYLNSRDMNSNDDIFDSNESID